MSPDQVDSAAEERALRSSIAAVVHDYPDASPDHVNHLLRERYGRTDGAKVQQYRVLLAERETRVRLRLDERDRELGVSAVVIAKLDDNVADGPPTGQTTNDASTRGLAWTQ